jgi:hypothetical protein
MLASVDAECRKLALDGRAVRPIGCAEGLNNIRGRMPVCHICSFLRIPFSSLDFSSDKKLTR